LLSVKTAQTYILVLSVKPGQIC